MSTDKAIEQEIQDKGLTAPRVTPSRIAALMERVKYKIEQPAGTTSTLVHAFLDGDFYLASGHSACVREENFNLDIGVDIATRNAARAARDKLWELEGYVLRDRLKELKDTKKRLTMGQDGRTLNFDLPRGMNLAITLNDEQLSTLNAATIPDVAPAAAAD